MARPSDLTDKNFLRLQHKLKLNPREAIGLLEYAWLLGNISGEAHYENAEDLAALLHWDDDPAQLAKALVETGYLIRHKGGGFEIAEFEEKRLQDWAKKRRQRAQEQKEHGGQRPPMSAKVRPTDPDSDSGSPSKRVIPFDPGSKRATDRDRPKTPATTTGRASKNPQEGVREWLQGAQRAVKGLERPGDHPKAPRAEQPIGSYSPRDCALAAAALDANLPADQAQAMWITRAAHVCQYTGGLDYFRELLATIANSRIAGNPKGVGTIHNPGAWLNKQTATYIARKASA